MTSTSDPRRMLATVCGERMFAKKRWLSSHTRVVPFGDRFGEPSSHTVAWNPSPRSRMMRFMSSVRIATDGPCRISLLMHHRLAEYRPRWARASAPLSLRAPVGFAQHPAHETAIHRVDAESAGGDVTGFPSGFAVDGIDELLLRFANRPGRTLPAVETTRSMVVRAKDEPRSWRVTFAPSGFQIEADPIDDDAELLVTGDASELYVLLWNRRAAAGSEMDGEPDLLDLWRETAQIRWS